MHTFLYIIWFLLPTFFFVMFLWTKLEQLGGSHKNQNPGDFLRQGIFVLISVLVAVGIDTYLLPSLVSALDSSYFPLGFFRVILLPVVLFLGARFFGPSEEIYIAKAPKPTKRKR